jgi:hypothetical protein
VTDLKRYRYSGPLSHPTLRRKDSEALHVALIPGEVVELPADHDYVKTLAAWGHITPVDDAAEETE